MGSYATRSGGGGGASGRIDTNSLPKLEGSEKQVAWAEDIRKNYVNWLNDFLESDELKTDEIRSRSAETFALDTFRDGILGTKGQLYDEMTKLQERGINWREAEDKAWDKWHKPTEKIDAKYRQKVDTFKKTGASKEEVKQFREKIKVEKSREYKGLLKEYAQYSLAQPKKASTWIDEFKNTKFNTYYKK